MRYDDLTAEQRPAFDAAKAACEQEIGQPPPLVPLTEAEIRERYSYDEFRDSPESKGTSTSRAHLLEAP